MNEEKEKTIKEEKECKEAFIEYLASLIEKYSSLLLKK